MQQILEHAVASGGRTKNSPTNCGSGVPGTLERMTYSVMLIREGRFWFGVGNVLAIPE